MENIKFSYKNLAEHDRIKWNFNIGGSTYQLVHDPIRSEHRGKIEAKNKRND